MAHHSTAHSSTGSPRLRELARREQGPLDVTLLWDTATGSAVVVVWDWTSGTCLRLEVEAQRVGYAFAHPYAFAAEAGVPADAVPRHA